MFLKIGVLKNSPKLIGKHLYNSLFFKKTLAQLLSSEFCEIFKSSFFLQNTSGSCFLIYRKSTTVRIMLLWYVIYPRMLNISKVLFSVISYYVQLIYIQPQYFVKLLWKSSKNLLIMDLLCRNCSVSFSKLFRTPILP